jgi:hypothetical protein
MDRVSRPSVFNLGRRRGSCPDLSELIVPLPSASRLPPSQPVFADSTQGGITVCPQAMSQANSTGQSDLEVSRAASRTRARKGRPSSPDRRPRSLSVSVAGLGAGGWVRVDRQYDQEEAEQDHRQARLETKSRLPGGQGQAGGGRGLCQGGRPRRRRRRRAHLPRQGPQHVRPRSTHPTREPSTDESDGLPGSSSA